MKTMKSDLLGLNELLKVLEEKINTALCTDGKLYASKNNGYDNIYFSLLVRQNSSFESAIPLSVVNDILEAYERTGRIGTDFTENYVVGKMRKE